MFMSRKQTIAATPEATPQVDMENLTEDHGRKLTIDNFDYHQNVHQMTEEHQNIDHHYVTVMATENRVAGAGLSTDIPAK